MSLAGIQNSLRLGAGRQHLLAPRGIHLDECKEEPHDRRGFSAGRAEHGC
jgi:hypothetical protein